MKGAIQRVLSNNDNKRGQLLDQRNLLKQHINLLQQDNRQHPFLRATDLAPQPQGKRGRTSENKTHS